MNMEKSVQVIMVVPIATTHALYALESPSRVSQSTRGIFAKPKVRIDSIVDAYDTARGLFFVFVFGTPSGIVPSDTAVDKVSILASALRATRATMTSSFAAGARVIGFFRLYASRAIVQMICSRTQYKRMALWQAGGLQVHQRVPR